MKQPCCSVYVHTLPNNKVYVGWTRTTPEKRWENGIGYSQTNFTFFKDIVLYGWNNIKHDVVADNLTDEQAAELETKLIQELNASDPRYGYNIITRKNQGLPSKKECLHGASESRIANSKDRGSYSTSKIVLQYDLLGNFIQAYLTATACAKALGVSPSSVNDTCKGKQFQCHGNLLVYEGEEDRIPILLREAKERFGKNGFGKVTNEYMKAYMDRAEEFLRLLKI